MLNRWALLTDFSKPFPCFHVEKNVGSLISRNEPGDTEKALELFEMNCVLAQKIGAEKLVLHLWNCLDSDKDFPHNIEVCKYVREIAERYQLLLTIENVVCNNSDPMTHHAELAEVYPDTLKCADSASEIIRLFQSSTTGRCCL